MPHVLPKTKHTRFSIVQVTWDELATNISYMGSKFSSSWMDEMHTHKQE